MNVRSERGKGRPSVWKLLHFCIWCTREGYWLHADPRLLRLASSLVQCVVLHDVSLSTNRSQGTVWWSETTSTLQRALRGEIPTIFLTDTHAHFWKHAVTEKECEGGSMFHALLLEFQVTIPSTFLGVGPAWRSTAGHSHRFSWHPRRMASRRQKCHHTPENCSSPSWGSRPHSHWSCCFGFEKQWVVGSRAEGPLHFSLLRKDQGCSRRCTTNAAAPGPRSASQPSGKIPADHLGWDMSED